MISPWQIYWVMQLDSISTALTVVSIALLIAAIVSGIQCGFARSMREIWDDREESKEFKTHNASAIAAGRNFKKASICAAIAMAIAAFIPSSKTAAAMIVIPAIANNERFQAEASDLYDLAKQGLKKIVATDEETPESK